MFRRLSLTTRLSLLFFIFTLVNIFVFWLAIGSNQMRLLAEKATLQIDNSLSGVEAKLVVLLKNNPQARHEEFYKSKDAVKTVLALFETKERVVMQSLLELQVATEQNAVLMQWSKEPKAKPMTHLTTKEAQNTLKARRLKEFSNESFYSFPDVKNFRLTVYMPYLTQNGQYLLLRAVFSLEGLDVEVSRLLRLGAVVMGLLLVIQGILAFFLYRLLVRPLRELKIGSQITGRGDFHQIVGYEKREDEVGALVASFNKMSNDIKEQKATIAKNFEEIKARDEMMQHELTIAQHIQKSIFPKDEMPHKSSLTYKPLYAVSGDFYDVYSLPDGSTAYVVCDASGHGVPAALLTMMAKTAFASAIKQTQDAGKLLHEVNKQLSTSLEMTGQYLTAFFVRVYPQKIEYCNATHPEPLVLLPHSEEVYTLASTGFYVGMLSEPPFSYSSEVFDTSPGTRIILYTDGITEARNKEGELYGIARFKAAIQKARALDVDALRIALLDDLESFTQGNPLEDDVTLLVLEV